LRDERFRATYRTIAASESREAGITALSPKRSPDRRAVGRGRQPLSIEGSSRRRERSPNHASGASDFTRPAMARLLMALGACSMQVRSERGWSGEMAAGMLAPIRGVLSRSAKASATAERSSEMLLEASLEPSGPPEIPSGLVWYSHEPSWRMVAEGRLHRRLNDHAAKRG
jgi:hypothetical protein